MQAAFEAEQFGRRFFEPLQDHAHTVKRKRADFERLLHSAHEIAHAVPLQQPQHFDELTRAIVIELAFKATPQELQRLGQGAVFQRPRVVNRARLPFQQGEIVHWVKAHPLLPPDAFVDGRQPWAADDLDVVHGGDQRQRLVGELRGHGVIVIVKAHQGQRVRSDWHNAPRFELLCRYLQERRTLGFKSRLFAFGLAAQGASEIFFAGLKQLLVEFREAGHLGHGHEVIAARKADQALDVAFLIGAAHAAEVIGEQEVAHQAQELARVLAFPAFAHFGYRDDRVVAGDAPWYAAEELKLDARYGKAAELWNRLIDDREAARRTQQAQQAHDARRDRRRGGGGRLDELCDSLATGLILLDDQGKVTYCNGAGAVLLRTRREELVGAAVAGWIEEPRLLEGLQAALDSTQRRRTTVEVDRGEDQRGSVLRFTVRPARESDAARAVMIIEDITQQRVAEKARYAFVTHATHELRTPLTNIRLYVENLLDDPQADEAERCRCLNVINQEVRRLENLVGDMLSVAEIEAGAMRADRDDVPMGAIFEQLEHDYREQAADKKLTLRFDMPPKLPTLQGDRDKLVQALHNLVGNALKYTPEGGEVTVKAEWEDGRLLVDVIDSGIGISEADLPHLFQKFYRAKDERVSKITGSGLGLALSREIIRLHGGDITIESQINQGSTFSVSLPAPSQAA